MEIKKLKKNILVSLAGLTLLSVGLVQNNNVQAATVRTGRNAYLSHNAYIYNAKGQKLSSGSAKNGTSFKVLAIKKIHGKKYVQIGKNEFIKLSNFTKNNGKSSADASTILVGKNSYVYNAKGHRVGKKMVKHGKVVPILNTVTIKGKKYVQIGHNQFIRFNNVDWNNDQTNASSSNSNVTKSTSNNTAATNNKHNGTPTTSTNNGQNTSPVNSGTSSSTTSGTTSGASSANNTTANQSDDSDDDSYPSTSLHNSYVFDAKGNRILGFFVIKGKHYEINNKVKISGHEFYEVQLWNGDDSVTGYVPTLAFEKDGKDQDFNSTTIKRLLEFKDYLSRLSVDNLVIMYSPKDKVETYYKANRTAWDVANQRWSSEEDIREAKLQLQKAMADLHGKPITVKGSPDNFNLTEDEKTKIINLANDYLHTDNASFSDDLKTIYYANTNGMPSSIPTSVFIRFSK